jgi:hypothetical protein
MRAAIYRSILLGLALGVSAGAWSRDLAGQWDLKIENREHHIVTALVIEFTAHPAQTCHDGIWLHVHVVSATTEDSKFFPASDPLSYNVKNNRLVLDHGGVCDGGAFLPGALNDETIRGEYISAARGLRQLGFFTLSKRK